MLPGIHRSHVYWVVIYLPRATPPGAENMEATWEAFVGKRRELGILIAATPATQSFVTTGRSVLLLVLPPMHWLCGSTFVGTRFPQRGQIHATKPRSLIKAKSQTGKALGSKGLEVAGFRVHEQDRDAGAS